MDRERAANHEPQRPKTPGSLRAIVNFVLRLLLRIEVGGVERVPCQGGLIVAVNHMSLLDAPLVYVLVPRQDLSALVADKHQKNPLLRFLVDQVHGIWINREAGDIQALRASRAYLHGGGALGIAPEGTRSRTGQMLPAKTGIVYLAEKAGVPIVPVAIQGTEDAAHNIRRLKRTPVRVQFGEPFHLPPMDRRKRDAWLQTNTDEIMLRIAAMLPPKYHGAYANHPRLKKKSNRDKQD